MFAAPRSPAARACVIPPLPCYHNSFACSSVGRQCVRRLCVSVCFCFIALTLLSRRARCLLSINRFPNDCSDTLLARAHVLFCALNNVLLWHSANDSAYLEKASARSGQKGQSYKLVCVYWRPESRNSECKQRQQYVRTKVWRETKEPPFRAAGARAATYTHGQSTVQKGVHARQRVENFHSSLAGRACSIQCLLQTW